MENYISLREFRPLKDNVLVRIDAAKDEAARDMLAPGSLLVMPDTTSRRPIDGAWATVIAVPETLESYRRSCAKCERPFDRYADQIAVGDRVILDSDKAGDAVIIDGVEHRIVRMAEILGVEEQ